MRKIVALSCILFIASNLSTKNPERFLVAGSGNKSIVLVDKETGAIGWNYDLPTGSECNTIDLTSKGELLFSYKMGARLINAKKETIWDFPLPEEGEMQTAFVLPDGGFLLAWCGSPATIVELDKKGRERKRIRFDTKIKNPHSQFRQISKSKKGTYLVPIFSKNELWEINDKGMTLRVYSLPAGAFSVMEKNDGNLIVSCGDAHLFVELDRQEGAIVRQVDQSVLSLPNSIHFVAQIIPAKNGNLYLANWNGHFKKGDTRQIPHIIEIDSSNRIVWLLNNYEEINRVSTIVDASKFRLSY